MDIYLTSAYLAPVQYYTKYISADRIFIEQCENYQKQSYRNRCHIVSANGMIPLSIPVEHSSKEKVLTKDIRIALHGKWQHVHWNAIVSAYNSTPFFEYYQDDFYSFYHKEYSFLFDFNQELNNLILELLDIDLPQMIYTEEYKPDVDIVGLDFRNSIHPKKEWGDYDKEFIPHPYYQVFDQKFGFIPNISIIDLLFNMGNESQIILSSSLLAGQR
jgi:WbqC-like protein family.